MKPAAAGGNPRPGDAAGGGVLRRRPRVGVVLSFEDAADRAATLAPLVAMVAADMERVNAVILSRTGSEVTMIPEVANHLISPRAR